MVEASLDRWKYTVLYQMLVSLASHTKGDNSVYQEFYNLWDIYGSLDPRAPCSCQSLSMKGDVLEFMLAQCRCTAYAVDPCLRDQRMSFNDLMKQYEEAMNRLYCLVFAGGYGPPVVAHCPNPDLFVTTIIWANNLVVNSGTQNFNHQFRMSCQATIASIGTWIR